MLSYNEITVRKYIVLDDEPYEVLSSHVFRKQQRKPVNQVKMKHLISGKVMEQSFHQSEKVEEADIETKKLKYLYSNRGEMWFSEENDPSQRFTIDGSILGSQMKFVKENSIVDAMVFNDDIIGLRLPIKVELVVKEAAPAVKGNTSQGASKQVVVETGATINVPIFINEGDTIRINTESGDYTERVEKGG